MFHKSRTNILADINKKIVSSRCFFQGIIAPPLSGKSYLLEEIKKCFSMYNNCVVYNTHAEKFLRHEDFIVDMQVCIEDHTGAENMDTYNELSIGDAIFNLINKYSSDSFDSFLFLVDNIDELSTIDQFKLLSQIRNVRENVNAHLNSKKIFFLCVGNWFPTKLRSLFEQKQGSYPFEEIYLDELSRNEIKSLFPKYFGNCIYPGELYIEYLYEVSSGCFGIVDFVLNKTSETKNFTCSFIKDCIKQIINENYFKDKIINSVKKLNISALNEIKMLLDKKFLRYDNDIISEELIMSGLVKKECFYENDVLILRSWVHELLLRTNTEIIEILNMDYTKLNIDEIIPPTPCVNKYAYKIVMDIENLLRNIVYIGLLKSGNFDFSPYEILIPLGKFDANWQSGNLMEELKLRKDYNENQSSVLIDTGSPLSSFLQPSELKRIIIEKSDKGGMNQYFEKYLISNDKNKKLLRKWTDIRNLVAHNHIISEKTVDKLMDIAQKIYFQIINK